MENRFIRAEDVAQELNVSKPYWLCRKLCRKANQLVISNDVYLMLKKDKPKKASVSVKSQMRRAIRLYFQYFS